jgi:hypothetical protein
MVYIVAAAKIKTITIKDINIKSAKYSDGAQ